MYCVPGIIQRSPRILKKLKKFENKLVWKQFYITSVNMGVMKINFLNKVFKKLTVSQAALEN